VPPDPISKLMRHDPDVISSFRFDNPPVFKALSKRRLANAQWKHYSKQQHFLRAPLPKHEVKHLQERATSTDWRLVDKEMKIKMENKLNELRNKTGRYQGKFSSMSPRFMRRRYQLLLNQYIPTISKENDTWKVEPVSMKKNFAPVQSEHMRGFTLADGRAVGKVDENGRFIEPPVQK
jgi:hypothetical protein